MTVFGQKWLYSGKSGCVWAKVVVFGKSGCILPKGVIFGQMLFYSRKSAFIRAKWLYWSKSSFLWTKEALFGKKVVEFVQKWLYSGKCGCIRQK